ncbi:hypothetical protein B0H12DRAFT_1209906 [Mycena haematopus]|nr:hypothetical protein B0H12DRAFT_1209906 [Mycena haematopus]
MSLLFLPAASQCLLSTNTEINAKSVIISLDTEVPAGGANFSQGQRQLIALARALLRRNTIVILGEATSRTLRHPLAHQATIREEFAGSLLFTVAHRFMDYERITVLVAEMDTPLRLMDRENGISRKMCLRSGSYKELEAIAQANV